MKNYNKLITEASSVSVAGLQNKPNQVSNTTAAQTQQSSSNSNINNMLGKILPLVISMGRNFNAFW